MRSLRELITGIATFTMIISFSYFAYAKMGHGAYEEGTGCQVDKVPYVAHIKVLRDSAEVLQSSNPVLAKGLNGLADKKEKKMKKWQERKDQHEATVKLLKDSAAALKTSNSALAQELEKMSEEKYMKEEAVEKEEAGEKMEPIQEQGETK